MTKRSLLQASILEKLAVPLATAVGEVSMRTGDGNSLGALEAARRTAELLGKTVQLGTTISAKMNIKGNDGDGESVRTMLTILSGGLISDCYRRTARVPGDNELNKITASLEATLAFSDNFIASDETMARINQMTGGSVYVDENQRITQFINAFVPVVNAVAAFSFGRSESVLVQEIADRLTARAAVLRKAAFGNDSGQQEADMAEILYLQGLVEIYVQCHLEEVEKMKGGGAAMRAGQDPIAPVWEAFELRATMLEALVEHIVPSAGTAVSVPAPSANVGNVAAPVAPPAVGMVQESSSEQSMNTPVAPAIFSSPVSAEKPIGTSNEEKNGSSAQEKPDNGPEKGAVSNPMSFFGAGKEKGKEDGDDGYV